MNCTGNCNQGRACRCARPMHMINLPKLLIIVAVAQVICVAALCEFVMTGSAWRTVAAAIAIGLLIAACRLLLALTDVFIAAIDWMTRHESGR